MKKTDTCLWFVIAVIMSPPVINVMRLGKDMGKVNVLILLKKQIQGRTYVGLRFNGFSQSRLWGRIVCKTFRPIIHG